MKRMVAVLAVVVLLLATVVPSDAWGGRHGGWHGGWRGGCCWWPGAVVGGLIVGSAVAAAAYPYYYAPPPAVIYEPAPAYVSAPPTPAPAVQREVVYPHGRYVLYGDGVSRAWQWVWVPNPPPAPAPPTN